MEDQWTEAEYEAALAKLEALTDKVRHTPSSILHRKQTLMISRS